MFLEIGVVKTYKNVLPQKCIVVAEETYSKVMKKRWNRKMATNVKQKYSHKFKGGMLRERER